ncbi:hypothetical protein [Streptomyces sp. P9-A2]|uniref:hypothetical protein n=1 Tax=Streptomyces sp. P9-A2 TaxID=3072284 RepID=UPI002FC9C58C
MAQPTTSQGDQVQPAREAEPAVGRKALSPTSFDADAFSVALGGRTALVETGT